MTNTLAADEVRTEFGLGMYLFGCFVIAISLGTEYSVRDFLKNASASFRDGGFFVTNDYTRIGMPEFVGFTIVSFFTVAFFSEVMGERAAALIANMQVLEKENARLLEAENKFKAEIATLILAGRGESRAMKELREDFDFANARVARLSKIVDASWDTISMKILKGGKNTRE